MLFNLKIIVGHTKTNTPATDCSSWTVGRRLHLDVSLYVIIRNE